MCQVINLMKQNYFCPEYYGVKLELCSKLRTRSKKKTNYSLYSNYEDSVLTEILKGLNLQRYEVVINKFILYIRFYYYIVKFILKVL